MYVKLRDAGTIFHDGTQGVSVTGKLPVKVKATPKINKAVKNGILVKVADKEAELAIATAKGNAEKAKANIKEAGSAELNEANTKLAQAETDLETANNTIADKDAEIATLKTQLENAGGDDTETVTKEAHDAVVKELEEAKTFIDNKATEFKNLTTENETLTADLDKANKELASTKTALETTKKALADATKKGKK